MLYLSTLCTERSVNTPLSQKILTSWKIYMYSLQWQAGVQRSILARPITTNKVPSCCGAAICPSSSSMTLQSNAHLRLLNGLLPVRSAFWPLTPICNFAFIHNCMYTIPPSVFGHPLRRLPWVLSLNIWLTFLLVSILLIWPIQFNRLVLTNGNLQTAVLIPHYIAYSNFHLL